MTASKQENVKWVDGLRGIASLLVVITHLTRSFDPDIYKPCASEADFPRVVQYPIIRFFLQGRIGVPIFSLVTGYVCALKPIRLFAAGQQEKALRSITSSAFRRVPRLVLPSSIATLLIWCIAQVGGFTIAHHCASWWILATAPDQRSLEDAIAKLVESLVSTWTRQYNLFEPNQWTLLPLLEGAFLVYMLLFATAYVKAKWRMVVELGMVVYYWCAQDPLYGIHFFYGAFLCDLSQYPSYSTFTLSHPRLLHILSPILLLLGLIFASFPEQNPEWQPWSNALLTLSTYIFPSHLGNVEKFYTGFGLLFIATSIHLSEVFKTVLSHRYLLWMGKVSFAVYLLHGTLLRTVLVWMLYGISLPKDMVNADGTVTTAGYLEVDSWVRWVVFIPVWMAFQYWVASQWMNYVDPWCARVTERWVKFVRLEEEKSVLPQ